VSVEPPPRRTWSLVNRLAARSLALALVTPVEPVGTRAGALLRLAGLRAAVLEQAARRVERGAFSAPSAAAATATDALRLAAHLAAWRLDEEERASRARRQSVRSSRSGPMPGLMRREPV
jgi:2-polyprenyl-6-methoxyphenol hydroxylase-like FAD-dependent oxidoreductase